MNELDEYLEYCRERDAHEAAREEQEKLEEQQDEELDTSSTEVDANFSVMAGNLRLFAKAVPPVEESGRMCFRWYLSLSVRTEDGVSTISIDNGKCMTENNARRAAFRSMGQYVKTMSQIAETWSQITDQVQIEPKPDRQDTAKTTNSTLKG